MPVLPKLSIVIPSYNQGQFIEQTICSIIDQQYPDLEIIVIDGGSTDHTIDIIKKHESAISYWVSEKDEGQANAINKGFEKASGEILGWINSDDYYLPGYLNLVGKTFADNKKVQIVYGNSITQDDRDSRVYYEYGKLILTPFLVFGSIVQSHTTFWRKSVHQDLDENISCAIDFELWLRLFPGKKWKHLNYFGAVFRVQNQSKSMGSHDNYKNKWEEDYHYIYKKHHLKKPGIWKVKIFNLINKLYKKYCQFNSAERGVRLVRL